MYLFSGKIATVIPGGDPRWNLFESQVGVSQISIGGGPVRGNNYFVDGIPVTDSTNRSVVIPAIESVAEMKVQEGTYDATMAEPAAASLACCSNPGSTIFMASYSVSCGPPP